jgi:hypothetical protein
MIAYNYFGSPCEVIDTIDFALLDYHRSWFSMHNYPI